jgi:hypothetical protein
MALIKYCSEAITDLYEIYEVALEIGKTAAIWMEAIPGLNLSPAYEILEAADNLIELGQSIFEATDTPEFREGQACLIMCWCIENGGIFDASVIDKWRTYLAGYGIIPPYIYYHDFVVMCSYRCLVDRFVLGTNDDDEDWKILCDMCGTEIGIVTFDDEETDLDYTISYGSVVDNGNPDNCLNGEEWGNPPENPYGRRAELTIELPEVSEVMRVEFQAYMVHSAYPEGELRREVDLLDESEVVLETWDKVNFFPKGAWTDTELWGAIVEGVKYIRLRLQFVTHLTGTRELRVDNIKILTPSE